jgi:hypothetical protein
MNRRSELKSRFLMYSAAIALFTALAIPLRLAAQNNQVHNNGNKHHHYVLIDMGTFGGPYSSLFGADALNSPGVTRFWIVYHRRVPLAERSPHVSTVVSPSR